MPHPTNAVHVPVLPREVVRELRLAPGLTVVDGTVGAGGHSALIVKAIQPGGRLIGVDRDPMMLAHAQANLPADNVVLNRASYLELPEILAGLNIRQVDRILLDLGLSSDQLADQSRGFSFSADGPLDLRFDQRSGKPAAHWLQTAPEGELAMAFREFGEEPLADRIAKRIVETRMQRPIGTALELAQLVLDVMKIPQSKQQDKHPATRVFQAVRIAVNSELLHVQDSLVSKFPACLKPGGILAVITFHSLEDRIVKEAFRNREVWENLTDKPIAPTPAEIRFNPRSRSAKLRVARRTETPAG